MKKFFSLILLGLFISTGAVAQTRTRKVPFLPYAGMPMTYTSGGYSSSSSAGAAVGNTTAGSAQTSSYDTIYFESDTNDIRSDQIKKLRSAAKKLKSKGNGFYSIVGFTTDKISDDVARARIRVAADALRDLGVSAQPITNIEYKKNPLVNPNRVEIYQNSTSLGSTIQ